MRFLRFILQPVEVAPLALVYTARVKQWCLLVSIQQFGIFGILIAL